MRALTAAAVAGTLLLLALRTPPVISLESPELGGHGHGTRGSQRASERAARLPIPTPQEIEALRQLLRILASLAGSSQVTDDNAPIVASESIRHSISPATSARRAGPAHAAAFLT